MIVWVGGGVIAWLLLWILWRSITPPLPIPPGFCGKCGYPLPSAANNGPCPECGSGIVHTTSHPWGTRGAWIATSCSLFAFALYTAWFDQRIDAVFRVVDPSAAGPLLTALISTLPIFFALGITIGGLRAWPRLLVPVISLQIATALGIAVIINERGLYHLRISGPNPLRGGLGFDFMLTYFSLPIGMSLYLLGALSYARWKHRRMFRTNVPPN